MANETKMLPPNIAVLWVPQTPGIADLNAPLASELSFDPEGSPAYNITCAIAQDNFTAQFTDRDTNNEKSLCDDSNAATPTYKNYEVSLTFFRDANLDQEDSVYNTAYELFRKPMERGFIITRVGYSYDEPFADGQDVQIFDVLSMDPQDVHADGESVKMTVPFLAQGRSSDGYARVGGES